eukprot:m.51607 g.51607  ORF g.51607 m.51607 type:complete len:96 (+) comp13006_c0_seq3:109-396(+)
MGALMMNDWSIIGSIIIICGVSARDRNNLHHDNISNTPAPSSSNSTLLISPQQHLIITSITTKHNTTLRVSLSSTSNALHPPQCAMRMRGLAGRL